MRSNYKVLFINNCSAHAYGDIDNDSVNHIDCLLNYINGHYKDDCRFNRLTSRTDVYDAGRYLAYFKDIAIIYNLANNSHNVNDAEAVLILPIRYIENELADKILSLVGHLEGYKKIHVEKTSVTISDNQKMIDGEHIADIEGDFYNGIINAINKSNDLVENINIK